MQQLQEGPSLDSTLKSVSNDIGNSISILYDRLEQLVQKYYDNNGAVKGAGKLVGGMKGQWFQTFYVNRLQNELYDLKRHAPKQTRDLSDFLRSMMKKEASFKHLEKELPELLLDIGRSLEYQDLTKNAQKWIKQREQFIDRMSELSVDDDGQYEPTKNKPEKSDIPGKQASQVEELVNSVLKKLPKRDATEIRQAVARSDNKLQTLAAEMNKRGLKS